jgi:hypothetical protein
MSFVLTDRQLFDYLRFESGPTEYRLGSWAWTEMTFYSGEAVYEKEFDLGPGLERGDVIELGAVGLNAQIWLNGEEVGTRLWAPFELGVTAVSVEIG